MASGATRASRDAVGASLLHALVIADTDESLELAMHVYMAKPELLLLTHIDETPFAGQNALHVLAVNRREQELCALVELAASRLARTQPRRVQARGIAQTPHQSFDEDEQER